MLPQSIRRPIRQPHDPKKYSPLAHCSLEYGIRSRVGRAAHHSMVFAVLRQQQGLTHSLPPSQVQKPACLLLPGSARQLVVQPHQAAKHPPQGQPL